MAPSNNQRRPKSHFSPWGYTIDMLSPFASLSLTSPLSLPPPFPTYLYMHIDLVRPEKSRHKWKYCYGCVIFCVWKRYDMLLSFTERKRRAPAGACYRARKAPRPPHGQRATFMGVLLASVIRPAQMAPIGWSKPPWNWLHTIYSTIRKHWGWFCVMFRSTNWPTCSEASFFAVILDWKSVELDIITPPPYRRPGTKGLWLPRLPDKGGG